VQDWLKGSAEVFFDEAIQKLVIHDVTYALNEHGNCVVKQFSVGINMLQ
jgi:hypothetical protein